MLVLIYFENARVFLSIKNKIYLWQVAMPGLLFVLSVTLYRILARGPRQVR
jgi:hypothetical protein